MALDIDQASDLFWTSWQHGTLIREVPSELRPLTREEGYAIQERLESRSATGVAGWKIAATSQAGQRHINVSGPLAGRILAERILISGATVSLAGNQMSVAEPEFVFVIGETIRPRSRHFELPEAMSHVVDLRLGIEVPDSRFASFTTAGEALLIADNACAHEFVLGPIANGRWREADLSKHAVLATVNGSNRNYERGGVGANVLSDPRVALTWLVNELSAHGMTLHEGQFVTTGTCMVPLEVQPGDAVSIDFGDFGTLQCQFR
jgi:2-keto-4-pentenoate hydratase